MVQIAGLLLICLQTSFAEFPRLPSIAVAAPDFLSTFAVRRRLSLQNETLRYASDMPEVATGREIIAQRGRRLEYFTIAWNVLEGVVAIVAGGFAGSISLVGFGIDSFIEVTSGSALLWRMIVDRNEEKRERNERLSLRIVGTCFLMLSGYIGFEAISDLVKNSEPERSVPGIILACVSLIAMPLLSRAKKKVGTELGSAALCTQMPGRRTSACICPRSYSLVSC